MMKNNIRTTTEVRTKPKISKIDKFIAVYCFLGIVICINVIWSHNYHGNDTVRFILGHTLGTLGGLIFYAFLVHGLSNTIKILIGTGLWIFNLYLAFVLFR